MRLRRALMELPDMLLVIMIFDWGVKGEFAALTVS